MAERTGKITIIDLARKLGVSIATISRALSGHADVHPETRERIIKLAKELNYQPNTIAQNLRTNKSNTIGLIIPEMGNSHYAEIAMGIQNICEKENFNLIMCQSNESQEREIKVSNVLLSSRVDALLIITSYQTESYDHINSFILQKIPVIAIDRFINLNNISNICIDYIKCGCDITNFFLSQEKNKIAFLGASEKLSSTLDFFTGCSDAITKKNINDTIEFQSLNNFSIDAGYYATKNILMRKIIPQVILFDSAKNAIGGLKAINEIKLSVPNDISVGTVDINNILFETMNATITGIPLVSTELGEFTMKSLIQILNSDPKTGFAPINHVLQCNLITK